MKMRRDHIVPLPTQTLDSLREIHQQTGRLRWVFPSQGQKPTISEGTINKAILRWLGTRTSWLGTDLATPPAPCFASTTGTTIISRHNWHSRKKAFPGYTTKPPTWRSDGS